MQHMNKINSAWQTDRQKESVELGDVESSNIDKSKLEDLRKRRAKDGEK